MATILVEILWNFLCTISELKLIKKSYIYTFKFCLLIPQNHECLRILRVLGVSEGCREFRKYKKMYWNCILIAWKCVNEWWKYHQSISEPNYTLFGTQLLKLAEIAKFCKKLYENLYQMYESVWTIKESVWKYFKWILQFMYILLVTKNVEIRT